MRHIFQEKFVNLLRSSTYKVNFRFYSSTSINDLDEKFDKLEIEPIISTNTSLEEDKFYVKPRQVWLESLDEIQEKKVGLVKLHPDIFGAQPRTDIIHQNVRWQTLYKHVSYRHSKTRAELAGGGRKPWAQKGLGKARHGSIRSPLWIKGGIAHGPRSHTPYYYLLPYSDRILGLISTLSVKLAQDDLHLIRELELPSEDPLYLLELIKERKWGPSVLFVDSEDFLTKNVALATSAIKHVNCMPVYGLNVYSMLKHDTLILTESASRLIESKLLNAINRSERRV